MLIVSGQWFCLLGLTDRPLKHALFVSPVLDMNRLIENMMKCAGIIESRLEEERVIPTAFGQTLSWEYLLYVREHPVVNWNVPTSILYAGKDQLTERFIVNDFVERFNCELTVMEDGEHWVSYSGTIGNFDSMGKEPIEIKKLLVKAAFFILVIHRSYRTSRFHRALRDHTAFWLRLRSS